MKQHFKSLWEQAIAGVGDVPKSHVYESLERQHFWELCASDARINAINKQCLGWSRTSLEINKIKFPASLFIGNFHHLIKITFHFFNKNTTCSIISWESCRLWNIKNDRFVEQFKFEYLFKNFELIWYLTKMYVCVQSDVAPAPMHQI